MSKTSFRILLVFLLGLVTWDAFAQAVPRPQRSGRNWRVKIDSQPQQAAIYLDDKQYGIVGYTPYKGRLRQGDYKLIVELPGFATKEQVVRVNRYSREFFVVLEKEIKPGVVDVAAGADPNLVGAQVTIDGQPIGTVPTQHQAKAGRHLIEIRKEGFEPFTQWIDVQDGQRLTLSPVLKPVVKAKPKGRLLVDADVNQAEVWLDGVRLDQTTPALVDGLDEGIHIVEVRKPPGVPWKQTVYVKGDELTKVIANLAPTVQENVGGNIRVTANVPGAEVWMDGVKQGEAPLDINNAEPGSHIIEVRAPGYAPRQQQVSVNAGSATVVSMTLQEGAGTTATPPGAGGGVPAAGSALLSVRTREPDARVSIDGAFIGTSPVEQQVSPGEHFIIVEKEGFARFERRVSVKAGQTEVVDAEMRSIGTVRFISKPGGAEIVLDGEVIGQAPLSLDVDVGEHIVTMRLEGYNDFEESIQVEGGTTKIVSGTLERQSTARTAEEVKEEVKGLSSYGARSVPFGRFTFDASLGYPYIAQVMAHTGIRDTEQYGWDVGFGFRTLLTTWEFLLGSRFRLYDRQPFSFGLFGQIGGGQGFDGRNMFSLQGGGTVSINFKNMVNISGRAFLDVYSDRLCGEPEDGDPDGIPNDGPEVCTNDGTVEQRAPRPRSSSARTSRTPATCRTATAASACTSLL